MYSEGVARGPISLTLTHASLFFFDEDTNDIIQDSISFSSLLVRLNSSYDELEIGEDDIIEKIIEKWWISMNTVNDYEYNECLWRWWIYEYDESLRIWWLSMKAMNVYEYDKFIWIQWMCMNMMNLIWIWWIRWMFMNTMIVYEDDESIRRRWNFMNTINVYEHSECFEYNECLWIQQMFMNTINVYEYNEWEVWKEVERWNNNGKGVLQVGIDNSIKPFTFAQLIVFIHN